jgi:transcriptional regulator with XRE-family HTH domain/Zn-dependent peptidase ImmA (M78 family)
LQRSGEETTRAELPDRDSAPPPRPAHAGAENLRFVLGLKLKSIRHEKGYSLKDVAERAGLSISYLSEIEKGKKYPKPERLLDLAGALGVPFDALVSLRVKETLGPVKAVFSSPLLREFPFELFGVEPEDLFDLITDQPAKAGALIRTFLEVGRTYDLHVEQFLLAAMRSYQQMHANYFEDIEREAARFRSKRGWPAGRPVPVRLLRGILEREYGYRVDEATLPAHPKLHGLRSVYRAGEPPTLFLNGRLMASQQAFVLAREIGYRHLGLTERAVTSSWLKVESFDQVLNNFKASYFSGAVLLDRETLAEDLRAFFARARWEGEALLACMRRYDATPETFFHRLTQLVPKLLGTREIYFMRFQNEEGKGRCELTKVLNMSSVPVPHGVGLGETYCRRWPGLQLLARLAPQGPGSPQAPVVAAQRSHFLDEDADFFVIAMARPLVLARRSSSSVSLGFRINDAFKRKVRFWDDPAVPRLDVNLTCERCRLTPAECRDRAAPPAIFGKLREQGAKEEALEQLLRSPRAISPSAPTERGSG